MSSLSSHTARPDSAVRLTWRAIAALVVTISFLLVGFASPVQADDEHDRVSVASVWPASGPVSGGTYVTIFGHGFGKKQGPHGSVTFGHGWTASECDVRFERDWSPNSITCVTGRHDPESVDVTVETNNHRWDTAREAFTYEGTYTVEFEANGGDGRMHDQSSTRPADLARNTFTRSGYDFESWNTRPDGRGRSFADGERYSFSADLTLYAQWSRAAHTVTFNENVGHHSDTTTQTSRDAAALDANTFTREGYAFVEWNTRPDGHGRSFEDGEEYSFSSDLTLYAQWSRAWHTVVFEPNGGAGYMRDQRESQPDELSPNAFTREGFGFDGWNTSADGHGRAFEDGEVYSFSADLTLYAQWRRGTHIVTFDANGGSGTMTPQAESVPTALKRNEFTDPTHSFGGWSRSQHGPVDYADGATYSFTSDATLYAQWTRNAADPARSTLAPAESTIVANGSDTQLLTVFAKDAEGNDLHWGGADVSIVLLDGSGSIGPVKDNGDGSYTAKVTAPSSVGTGSFEARIAGVPLPHEALVIYTTGQAKALSIHAGGGQSAPVGSSVSIPPSVIVTDESGNPVPGVDVTFEVGSGGGSINGHAKPDADKRPGRPEQPHAVAGVNKGEIAITVAPGHGGMPSTYEVTADPDGETCEVPAESTSCTIDDLTIGTEYTFTATAANAAGTSASSEPSHPVKPAESGRDPKREPGRPPAPDAVAGPHSATVTVTAGQGGTPETFAVMSEPDGATCDVAVGSRVCVVVGLTPGVSYTFTARATNGEGTSDSSEPSNPITPTRGPAPVPVPDPDDPVDDPADGPLDDPTDDPADGPVDGPLDGPVDGPLASVDTPATPATAAGVTPGAATVADEHPGSTTVSVATGSDGVAALGGWTLGQSAGRNTLQASAVGEAVIFTATATAGPSPDPGPTPGPGPGPAPGPGPGPAPDPGTGGGSSSGTGSGTGSTPSGATAPMPVPDPTGVLPNLRPGQSLFMINRQVRQVTVRPITAPAGLAVHDADFRLEFVSLRDDGTPLELAQHDALQLRPGGMVRVIGRGFQPGSRVDVWILQEAQWMGSLTVAADGALDGKVRVPKDVVHGNHTLQANGTTVAADERSISLGVVAGRASIVRARVYFGDRSTSLTKAGKRALAAMVVRVPGRDPLATIVKGAVPVKGAESADRTRAKARAQSITKYLRGLGLKGPIEVRNTARTRDASSLSRHAMVSIVYVG